MKRTNPSHHDSALHSIINRAGICGAAQNQLLRSGSRERYEAMAPEPFPRVEATILRATLRVPYTILIMRCGK